MPELADHNRELQKVYREIERRETARGIVSAADAALLFVGYGTCARLCREATDILRDEGLKAGLSARSPSGRSPPRNSRRP